MSAKFGLYAIIQLSYSTAFANSRTTKEIRECL